jgi:hypothetical protein
VKTKHTLDDGEWHRIDVFWDTEVWMIGEKKCYCKNRVLILKVFLIGSIFHTCEFQCLYSFTMYSLEWTYHFVCNNNEEYEEMKEHL